MTRLGRLHDWWTRPCGAREVLRVSLPLVVSTISTTVMIFIDRMFLLWYAPKAMAAAMPAGMLHFTIVSFPLGVALYVNTFVAQYEGAGRPWRIGPIVWQGMWIGILAAPLLLATTPWVSLLLASSNQDPELARLESTFYRVLTFGSGAMIIAAAQVSFFTGREKTRVVMCRRYDGNAVERRAGLRVDFRAFRVCGRRHRRGRLGHYDGRVVSRARLQLPHAAAGQPPGLSVGGRMAAQCEG